MSAELMSPLLGVLSLFIVIAAGGILRVLKVADTSWCDVMNRFALYIGFPCLLFLQIADAPTSEWRGFPLTLLVVGLNITVPLAFSYFGAWAVWKDRIRALSFASVAVYGNVAYLGFPITTRVFPGTDAHVGMVVTAHILVFFTVVVGVMEWLAGDNRPSARRMLARIVTNPFIIAMATGCIFSLLGWRVPGIVRESMTIIGRSVTAVVLVSLGIYLGAGQFLVRPGSGTWLVVLVKLFAMPLMTLVVALPLMDNPGPITLESAMPSAVTVYALSSRYRLDKDILSTSIPLTAVLSLATLPLWVIILGLIQ